MSTAETLIEIERHIDIINGEMGEIAVRLGIVESQVGELLWMQRLVAGLIVTAIVGAILSLIIKRNGKSSKQDK